MPEESVSASQQQLTAEIRRGTRRLASEDLDGTGTNGLRQSLTEAADIANTATEIIDLGTNITYYELIINAIELDQEVIITFANGRTLNVAAGDQWGFDNYAHNGVITLHYEGARPTTGRLQTVHT